MQAKIRNDQGGEWVLYDGDQGQESTNGTWLYLNEDCVIEDGMIFKRSNVLRGNSHTIAITSSLFRKWTLRVEIELVGKSEIMIRKCLEAEAV